MRHDALFKSFSTSLLWTSGHRGVQMVIAAGLSLVLARLLTPADYGLVGMVTVITNFLLFSNTFGLNALIVRRPALDDEFLTAVFWFNAGTVVLVTLLIVIVSPLMALYYHDDRVVPIAWAMALLFTIDSVGMVSSSLLRRSFRVRDLSVISLISLVCGGITAITLASKGYGVWSLVAHELVSRALEASLTFAWAPWKPSFRYRHAHIRECYPFLLSMTGNKVVAQLLNSADFLIVGRVLGATDLGFYVVGFRIAVNPVRNATTMFGGALLPFYSRLQDDARALLFYVSHCLRALAVVLFPVSMAFLLFPFDLIRMALGEQWLPAGNVLRLFSVLLISDPIGRILQQVFIARQQVRLLLSHRTRCLAVMVPALVMAALIGGIEWVALTYVLFNVILVGVQMNSLLRMLEAPFVSFAARWLREYPFMAGLMLWLGLGKLVDAPVWPLLGGGITCYFAVIAWRRWHLIRAWRLRTGRLQPLSADSAI